MRWKFLKSIKIFTFWRKKFPLNISPFHLFTQTVLVGISETETEATGHWTAYLVDILRVGGAPTAGAGADLPLNTLCRVWLLLLLLLQLGLLLLLLLLKLLLLLL